MLVWPELTPALKELLVQGSASLAGAFAGAAMAFALEAWRQGRKEKQNQINRMNKAIFSLGMRRNYLVNLKREQLDPTREHPIRAFLPPVLLSPLVENVEWTELTFLLTPPGQGDLLYRFAVGDEVFRMVLGLVELRRELHARFQERLDALENREAEPSLELIREVAGMALFAQLTSVTDHLYESVEQALTTNRNTYTRMTEAFVGRFPKTKHVRIEEPDEPLSL